MRFRILTLLVAASLCACGGDAATALYDDYISRLANAGGVDVAERADEGTPRHAYPRGRDRVLPVPEVRGGLLDIFRLSTCDVATLIAERNSILGRHADAAALFTNGGALLHRLDRCAEHISASMDAVDDRDRRLLDRLVELDAAKRPSLHALAWNASFGSTPMAEWWRRSQAPLPPQRSDAGTAAAQQLQLLLAAHDAALAGRKDEADARYSEAYQALRTGAYGGAWLKGVELSLQSLDRVIVMVDAIDSGRMCPQQVPTPRARVLQTVFQQRYVEGVQPYLARLDRDMQQLSAVLEQLWDTQSAAAPDAVAAFRDAVWRDSDDSLHGRLRAASLRHAQAWQSVLQDCGMLPQR